MSQRSLTVRISRSKEEWESIKVLSLCYEFHGDSGIMEYLQYVLDRGLAEDADKYNRAAEEHNARLAAEKASNPDLNSSDIVNAVDKEVPEKE